MAKFVIPDWGAVIAMLPVFILVLAVVVLVVLVLEPVPAPKPRRGKQRMAPRTPAGVHMPGPSWAPIFAAIGAFLLFLGWCSAGPMLVARRDRASVLTLLYWLGEALRVYDHDLGLDGTATARGRPRWAARPASTCRARR